MLQKTQPQLITKFTYLLLIIFTIGILIHTSCKNKTDLTNGNTTVSSETSLKNTNNLTATNDHKANTTQNNIVKKICADKDSEYDMHLNNYLKITLDVAPEIIVNIISTTRKKQIRSVYLEKKSIYYIENIPEGKYEIHIAYGNEYAEKSVNGKCIGYFKNEIAKEINNILDFSVDRTDLGVHIPSYNLILDSLPNEISKKR